MNAVITERRADLDQICRKFQVRKLALFGSALGSEFDEERSDVDLLVDFLPMDPRQRVDAYFGLLQELERLFERRVDLVELRAVRNPYLRHNIESTQETLYGA
jgi:uncharacterized protein